MRSVPLQADGEAAAVCSHSCVLVVCLGILSVLLTVSISVIIYSEFHVNTLSDEQLHQLTSHLEYRSVLYKCHYVCMLLFYSILFLICILDWCPFLSGW